MATHLITGHAGAPHVSSSDQRHQNAILHGAGAYIISGLECTLTNANTAHIANGEMMLNGAYVRVTGSGEDIAIASGSVGVTRIDYICARYELLGDSTERVTIVCKQGVGGAAPTVTEGNILDGANIAEYPLYSITIDGITPGNPVKIAQDFQGFGALARLDALTANEIPNIPASKISSGTLAAARIPDIDAAKIATGTLGADRIPNISAAKITSGTLPLTRGGTGATSAAAARTALGLGAGATISPNDYISAQGKSGNWNYIKWNSGYCMLWGTQSVTVPTANWANFGGWYTAAVASVSYPFTITSEKSETASVGTTSTAFTCGIIQNAGNDGSTTKTPTYLLTRPSTGPKDCTFTIYHQVWGKWK